MKRFMVFEIGCLECGVSSSVAGFYDTRDEAEAAAALLHKRLNWRHGGESVFEVFDLAEPVNPVFAEALS